MSIVTEDQIDRYLGNSSVSEFDSIQEIKNYFKLENLIMMFGPDNDFSDAKMVMDDVIELWTDRILEEEIATR